MHTCILWILWYLHTCILGILGYLHTWDTWVPGYLHTLITWFLHTWFGLPWSALIDLYWIQNLNCQRPQFNLFDSTLTIFTQPLSYLDQPLGQQSTWAITWESLSSRRESTTDASSSNIGRRKQTERHISTLNKMPGGSLTPWDEEKASCRTGKWQNFLPKRGGSGTIGLKVNGGTMTAHLHSSLPAWLHPVSW